MKLFLSAETGSKEYRDERTCLSPLCCINKVLFPSFFLASSVSSPGVTSLRVSCTPESENDDDVSWVLAENKTANQNKSMMVFR